MLFAYFGYVVITVFRYYPAKPPLVKKWAFFIRREPYIWYLCIGRDVREYFVITHFAIFCKCVTVNVDLPTNTAGVGAFVGYTLKSFIKIRH